MDQQPDANVDNCLHMNAASIGLSRCKTQAIYGQLQRGNFFRLFVQLFVDIVKCVLHSVNSNHCRTFSHNAEKKN